MIIALNAEGYIFITPKILNMKYPKRNTTPDVDAKLISALTVFLDASPPPRLSKHLRRILLDYISREEDCLPIDFDVYLSDLSNLFEFLDAICEIDI